ncbi:hypothetical protein [uncultured Corynebacterium sp.]|uniref:hypothetical protein n=1 Tax=uncultured Corynebacterium sp. TaxID=159447 RepID=UPI00260FF960|nr:hypothetical protein [uncultured Corynebacterium sp.]
MIEAQRVEGHRAVVGKRDDIRRAYVAAQTWRETQPDECAVLGVTQAVAYAAAVNRYMRSYCDDDCRGEQ